MGASPEDRRVCPNTYLKLFILPSTLTKTSVPAEEKQPQSLVLPPPCFTVGMLLFWRCAVVVCGGFGRIQMCFCKTSMFLSVRKVSSPDRYEHVSLLSHVVNSQCCRSPVVKGILAASMTSLRFVFLSVLAGRHILSNVTVLLMMPTFTLFYGFSKALKIPFSSWLIPSNNKIPLIIKRSLQTIQL